MSVDLNQLAAHLPTAQREAVKQAYHKQATNSTTVFLLCFFLGWCGAHRFYLGQAGKGFARLLVPLILVPSSPSSGKSSISSASTLKYTRAI